MSTTIPRVTVKDVRHSLTTHKSKTYRYRSLQQIKTIAVHHSATTSGSAEAFAKYHVNNLGWPGVAYAYVIEQDGTVKWCHEHTVRTYHVGNSNTSALGICMVGDFTKQDPTKEQYQALYAVLDYLLEELPAVKGVESIRGHQEYPGYSWKTCPSLDMDRLRGHVLVGSRDPVESRFSNDHNILIKKPNGFASPNPEWYVVQPGDSLWQIANNHGKLSVEDLLRINPGLNPKRLKVGQRLRLRPEPKKRPKPEKQYPLTQDILKRGDRGDAVRGLQQALNKLEMDAGVVDGIFGSGTEAAVTRFQKEFAGLKDDGVFDRATRIVMEKCLKHLKSWRG